MPSSVSSKTPSLNTLLQEEAFIGRHIGPDEIQLKTMLEALGLSSMEELIDETVPEKIWLYCVSFLVT